MIRCILVDDEPLAQQLLKSYCDRIPELQVVRICDNAIQAFEVLHKESIDLIFLDINMPVINGLGFLRSLQNPPTVILTTAYPQHAVESYDLNVLDFLLKPISFERFFKAVNKVLQLKSVSANPSPDADFLFVKADYKLVRINFADILYVEGMKDYLKIFTREKMFVVHQTMKKIEEDFQGKDFIRVHKSYIVSMKAVKSIVGNYLEIQDKEIPIGATYKEDLLKAVLR